MLAWWHYIQVKPGDMFKCRTIIRLILDCHGLKTCQLRYKQEGISNPLCEFCDINAPETIEHLLFECNFNVNTRQAGWEMLRQQCLPKLLDEMDRMNNSQKAKFILSGFGNGFVLECVNLYEVAATFVYVTYNERMKLYK